MSEETTAIEKKEKAEMVMGPMGFELNNLDQVYRYGKIVCASGIAPKDETPEGVVIKIEYGRQLGLSNMAALQNIANINGRPSLWGDAALALVRASGLVDSFVESFEGSGDGLTAICRTKRKGEPDIHERTFSVEDAKMANLWGKVGPWKQYPKRMLQMRARGWAMRDVYPDVLKGISLAEEARDIPTDYIDIAAEEAPEKQASKSEGLAGRIKARKKHDAPEAPQHTPDAPKTSPEPETAPSSEELEESSPVDEAGKPLNPEGDAEEAQKFNDDEERAALIEKIEEHRKWKPRTFRGYIAEVCEKPEHWQTEMSIESMRCLAEKLESAANK